MNTLKQGAKGGDVKLLQKYMGVTQDGIWGPKTTEAIKKWQTKLAPILIWLVFILKIL